jgi:hypothetical protein
MSQETAWTIEEMGRAMRAERLAEAERYRLAALVSGPSQSPRMLVAKVLRSLATLLDGDVGVQTQPDRRLARAA